MQKASDCDKILIHDCDLLMIDGIGHDTVSALLNGGRIVPLMSAVTGDLRTGHDSGSPREVRHKDT